MINRGLVWSTAVIVTSIMLTGCGSDTPEDVAKTFVTSLSEADMDSARDVASERTKKSINRLEYLCNVPYRKELTNEVLAVYKTIDSSYPIADLRKKINSPEVRDEMMKNLTKVKEELLEKYGSFKKAPESLQEKVMEDIKSKITDKYVNPMINNAFDELKIETKHPDEVKSILSVLVLEEVTKKQYTATDAGRALLRGSGGGLGSAYSHIMGELSRSKNVTVRYIIGEGNYQDIDYVTAECVAKYTDYDFVDSVNIIELKQGSPDKGYVRLELIDTDDKSTKVSVNVEKIKDEWKVSSLPLYQ